MTTVGIRSKYSDIIRYHESNGWERLPSSPSHITFDRFGVIETDHQDLIKDGCILRIIEAWNHTSEYDQIIIYQMMFDGDTDEFLNDPRKFKENDFTRMSENRFYYIGCNKKYSWWEESYTAAQLARFRREQRQAAREGKVSD